jgi:hypothetical protein
MNSIRNVVPDQHTTARRRSTRLAQAVPFVLATLVVAISCADGGVTEPLVPVDPLAGLKASYDSVAPMEDKMAALASAGPVASLSSSSASASSASASAAAAASMNVSAISFNPESGPFAHQLPGCDDCVFGGTSGFPIGFDFKYFGTVYRTFWVSTNGFLAFTKPPHNGCCHGATIPVFDNINNMVALAWVDMVPQGGEMSFETRGTAPNRRLIFNLSNVLMFNEGGRRVSAQLILYERSNNIELHTASQPQVVNHRVTQGAENQNGTDAAFVAGRVASRTYTATNDAIRFVGEAVNAIPVAIPGGNAGPADNRHYEGVEGTDVQFKGSGADADNDVLSYRWDFDNDGQFDAESAEGSFSYADNGTYTATLEVDDGHGGVGRASVSVVVKNAPPVVSVGSDVRINAAETVDFSGTFSDKGVRDYLWHWTYNLGSEGSYYGTTETQPGPLTGSRRFCKAGTFPVKLTVLDKDGDSGSDELLVMVDALPVQIDINPNVINLNGNGHAMITVRIFSSPTLDATALSPDVAKLRGHGGKGTSPARTGGGLWHWNTDADVNGDGRLDVVAGFRRDELIANGDLHINSTELRLTSQVGSCGDVEGKAQVRANVQAKNKSAASTIQPTGEAATPMNPSQP